MPADPYNLFKSSDLSLRDHFAALALTGLLAARVEAQNDDDSEPAPLLWHSATTGLGWNYDNTAAVMAKLAYELADAMLLARDAPSYIPRATPTNASPSGTSSS